MSFLSCDKYKDEVSNLRKELQKLQVDLLWYVNQYGVRNKSSVNNTLRGGSRKRKNKRTKQRSRRTRV
jgi:hypothetical protein